MKSKCRRGHAPSKGSGADHPCLSRLLGDDCRHSWDCTAGSTLLSSLPGVLVVCVFVQISLRQGSVCGRGPALIPYELILN